MGTGKGIIRVIIVVFAIINLIAVFGFEYKIPGINKKGEPIESVTDAAMEDNIDADESDQSNTAITTEMISEGSTSTEENTGEASIGENGTTEKNVQNQIQKCKVISSKNARIRSGPGTEYERITSVPPGTILTILGEEKGWYHIQTEDNVTGYISGELIELL